MIGIDERVKAEERQLALENELKESHDRELVGRVAGGIAHDFNNSLQAIIGFSEILASNVETGHLIQEDIMRNNRQVLKAVTSASELVRQLLALGKRQTLALEVFDIADWLEECRPIVSTILDSNINFSIHAAAGLTVEGDTSQLERVVANLALNAKDAMPNGGHFIISAALKDNHIEVDFRDTGTGVPESMIEQIFEPFFTSKDVHQGSGLGLAVTAGIIEQHSGQNKAESTEGLGTTIKISLPYSTGQENRSTLTTMPLPNLHHEMCLLVFDDRSVIRELIASMLKDQPVKVIEAKDGFHAVEKYKAYQDSIDMVLLDIDMPGQNGDLAAVEIRAMKPDIPIVFMTGYAGDYTDLSAFHNEVVIKKPFNRSDLFSVLMRYQQS